MKIYKLKNMWWAGGWWKNRAPHRPGEAHSGVSFFFFFLGGVGGWWKNSAPHRPDEAHSGVSGVYKIQIFFFFGGGLGGGGKIARLIGLMRLIVG